MDYLGWSVILVQNICQYPKHIISSIDSFVDSTRVSFVLSSIVLDVYDLYISVYLSTAKLV